jgi:AcrR family transcriptional regulator
VEDRVVRYGSEHKQATRRRILEVAGRRFKMDGIDGSGIATVMKDAELTNGAFYAHFASKDDLVANVVTEQLTEQAAQFRERSPGHAGVEQIVREYLSPEHRDHPGEGCPSAALLDEIGRSDQPIKEAYTEGLMTIVDDVAARLAPHDPASARARTLTAIALLIGTLQLSRALADPQLADDLLQQGIDAVLTALGVDEPR